MNGSFVRAFLTLMGVALAATQAAGVTRSLLTFSRRAQPEMSPVDLRAVAGAAENAVAKTAAAVMIVVARRRIGPQRRHFSQRCQLWKFINMNGPRGSGREFPVQRYGEKRAT